MTRKTLIALLFIFILSACGSNVETIPTSTAIPTLQATSTFTPEPTATNTPIPTATPFQYTSCADPELMREVNTNFETTTGITIVDFMAKLLKSGKYDSPEGYAQGQLNFTILDVMYAGNADVSLEHLDGASKGDRLFCLYVVDDADPSVLIPVPYSYSYKGQYYELSPLGEKPKGGEYVKFKIGSAKELRDFMLNGEDRPKLGDVMSMQFNPLTRIQNLDQLANSDHTVLTFAANVARLLKLLDNDYLGRVAGNPQVLESVKNLDTIKGDLGLFIYSLRVQFRNPLGE